jgi:ABC-type antimicrobial peptide transport system permease subunit
MIISKHVTLAWRRLRKDLRFSLLNLLGLSAGLACALLIYLWVSDERQFDHFFDHSAQIYQLMELRNYNHQLAISDESSGQLGDAVARQMPEVQYEATLAPPAWFQSFTLSVGDKNIQAVGQYAEPEYFQVFSFKLLEGNRADLLRDKGSIVISENLAKKLFQTTENLLGKTILFQHDREFAISGVFANLPAHSSQQFDFVLSFDYYRDIMPWVKNWYATGPHNFVLLKPGTDIGAFNRKIAHIIRDNTQDTSRQAIVLPFADSYLMNTFEHGQRLGGRIEYVRLFSLIAIFILAIACINFMNLSTAKSSRKLRDAGVQKVLGARRDQLIGQYLVEPCLLALAALIIAIGICFLLLPEFNQLTGKQISLIADPGWIPAALLIALFTGLVSGSFPALYLSGFDPVTVLKGKFPLSNSSLIARKSLVIFQFSLSVLAIIGVLAVYRQMRLIQMMNLGYNRDHVIRFKSEGKVLENQENFRMALKQIPGVVNASATYHNLIGRNYGTISLDWDGKDPNTPIYFEGIGASYDFVETMGMEMASGRSFSKEFGSDSNKILINQTAAQAMGYKDPIGKRLTIGDVQTYQIIGVVRDFHFESLHEKVKPLYIQLDTKGSTWYKNMVRLRAGQERETIARLQQFYSSYNPGFIFDYQFLDQAYQDLYQAESRVSVLSRYFAGLAILISCLGLFGLAAFTAQQREKEIGIRKVVGASVGMLVFMLSKEFLKLVGASILVAFPLSWWLMRLWLNGFAYRVPLKADIFLIAGGAMMLITACTVSFQSVRAALANPVKSLRSE